jgi:hypothetical protein
MMTKSLIVHVASSSAWLLSILILLFGSSAYALKVQQLSPLQLIENAQFVVAVEVTPGEGPWEATLIEVIKAPLNKKMPARIRFAAFSRTEGDTPQFIAGDKRLLFLSENENGIYQCLSYGKQAIWPKTQIEWPYNKDQVSTYDDALSTFRGIQMVLSEVDESASDRLLATALKRDNLLLRSIAIEFLSSRSKERFPQSHATLANTSRSDASQNLEHEHSKLNQLAPTPKAESNANLAPSVQPVAAPKAPDVRSTPLKSEEPTPTKSWSIIGLSIVAGVSLLLFLLRTK